MDREIYWYWDILSLGRPDSVIQSGNFHDDLSYDEELGRQSPGIFQERFMGTSFELESI